MSNKKPTDVRLLSPQKNVKSQIKKSPTTRATPGEVKSPLVKPPGGESPGSPSSIQLKGMNMIDALFDKNKKNPKKSELPLEKKPIGRQIKSPETTQVKKPPRVVSPTTLTPAKPPSRLIRNRIFPQENVSEKSITKILNENLVSDEESPAHEAEIAQPSIIVDKKTESIKSFPHIENSPPAQKLEMSSIEYEEVGEPDVTTPYNWKINKKIIKKEEDTATVSEKGGLENAWEELLNQDIMSNEALITNIKSLRQQLGNPEGPIKHENLLKGLESFMRTKSNETVLLKSLKWNMEKKVKESEKKIEKDYDAKFKQLQNQLYDMEIELSKEKRKTKKQNAHSTFSSRSRQITFTKNDSNNNSGQSQELLEEDEKKRSEKPKELILEDSNPPDSSDRRPFVFIPSSLKETTSVHTPRYPKNSNMPLLDALDGTNDQLPTPEVSRLPPLLQELKQSLSSLREHLLVSSITVTDDPIHQTVINALSLFDDVEESAVETLLKSKNQYYDLCTLNHDKQILMIRLEKLEASMTQRENDYSAQATILDEMKTQLSTEIEKNHAMEISHLELQTKCLINEQFVNQLTAHSKHLHEEFHTLLMRLKEYEQSDGSLANSATGSLADEKSVHISEDVSRDSFPEKNPSTAREGNSEEEVLSDAIVQTKFKDNEENNNGVISILDENVVEKQENADREESEISGKRIRSPFLRSDLGASMRTLRTSRHSERGRLQTMNPIKSLVHFTETLQQDCQEAEKQIDNLTKKKNSFYATFSASSKEFPHRLAVGEGGDVDGSHDDERSGNIIWKRERGERQEERHEDISKGDVGRRFSTPAGTTRVQKKETRGERAEEKMEKRLTSSNFNDSFVQFKDFDDLDSSLSQSLVSQASLHHNLEQFIDHAQQQLTEKKNTLSKSLLIHKNETLHRGEASLLSFSRSKDQFMSENTGILSASPQVSPTSMLSPSLFYSLSPNLPPTAIPSPAPTPSAHLPPTADDFFNITDDAATESPTLSVSAKSHSIGMLPPATSNIIHNPPVHNSQTPTGHNGLVSADQSFVVTLSSQKKLTTISPLTSSSVVNETYTITAQKRESVEHSLQSSQNHVPLVNGTEQLSVVASENNALPVLKNISFPSLEKNQKIVASSNMGVISPPYTASAVTDYLPSPMGSKYIVSQAMDIVSPTQQVDTRPHFSMSGRSSSPIQMTSGSIKGSSSNVVDYRSLSFVNNGRSVSPIIVDSQRVIAIRSVGSGYDAFSPTNPILNSVIQMSNRSNEPQSCNTFVAPIANSHSLSLSNAPLVNQIFSLQQQLLSTGNSQSSTQQFEQIESICHQWLSDVRGQLKESTASFGASQANTDSLSKERDSSVELRDGGITSSSKGHPLSSSFSTGPAKLYMQSLEGKESDTMKEGGKICRERSTRNHESSSMSLLQRFLTCNNACVEMSVCSGEDSQRNPRCVNESDRDSSVSDLQESQESSAVLGVSGNGAGMIQPPSINSNKKKLKKESDATPLFFLNISQTLSSLPNSSFFDESSVCHSTSSARLSESLPQPRKRTKSKKKRLSAVEHSDLLSNQREGRGRAKGPQKLIEQDDDKRVSSSLSVSSVCSIDSTTLHKALEQCREQLSTIP